MSQSWFPAKNYAIGKPKLQTLPIQKQLICYVSNFDYKFWFLKSGVFFSWEIDTTRLIVGRVGEWVVLELPYDEADQNDLGSNAINMLKWSWDVTVEKSGSDSIDTTIYALSVCDARVGDK